MSGTRFVRGVAVPPAVYVYQEFPKWITNPLGERLIVNDAAEEAAEMAKRKTLTLPKKEK